MKENTAVTAEGTVARLVRNAVVLQLSSGNTIRATLSGRMQKNRVRVMAGDAVVVEMTPYDLNRGRIIWRG
jgi:translation initiation factor IF-1